MMFATNSINCQYFNPFGMETPIVEQDERLIQCNKSHHVDIPEEDFLTAIKAMIYILKTKKGAKLP